jgi:hypothetical protein
MNRAACFGFTFLFIPLVAFVNFEKSVAKSSPDQSWICEKGAYSDGGVPAPPSFIKKAVLFVYA